MLYLVLCCILSHLLKALVSRLQHHLFLLIVAGRVGLARRQGMQAQLGQAAHEHMQPPSHSLLHVSTPNNVIK